MHSLKTFLFCSILISFAASVSAQYSPDPSFQPAVAGGTVFAGFSQKDGKQMIAGSFSSINGVPRNRLARLHVNGEVDLSFDPGEGPNQSIESIAPLPDGSYLVLGAFTTFNGVNRPRLVKLRTDGSFDPGFQRFSNTRTSSEAGKVIVDADGKVLVSGSIVVNGAVKPFIRLKRDGRQDETFEAFHAIQHVTDFELAPDGKLVMGGVIKKTDGKTTALARFTSNGALDDSFNAAPLDNGEITTVKVQPDGKVLVTGSFTSINGYSRKGIARFNSSGDLDLSFALPAAINARRLLPLGNANSVLLENNIALSVVSPTGSKVFSVPQSQVISAMWTDDGGGITYALPTALKRIVQTPAPEYPVLKGFQVFAVELNGMSGSNYRIEAAEDLTVGSWSTVTNLTLKQQREFFFDLSSSNGGKRFYRAVGP